MKASDELFQLIRSLTPSEKRYFKTNAKKESATSNYLQLFDAIDAQKEYDEPALKKKHAGKKFVKYLSAEKGYLHDQIMKQMRAYHADRTIDNKINELLQDEAIYRGKGLNELRKRTLDKVKGLADSYERFGFQHEIVLRQAAYTLEFAQKELEDPIKDLVDELLSIQKTISNFGKVWALKKDVFSLYRSGADFKDAGVLAHLESVKDDLKALYPSLEHSFALSKTYHLAMSDYYNCINDRQKSYEHLSKNYDEYNQHPEYKGEYLLDYRLLLSNLIGRAHALRKYEAFDDYLEELKALPVDSFNAEGEVFQNVYFLEHLRYINSGEFEKAEALVPTIEEGLEKYSAKINKARELSFKCNIMVMYFVMHRFKEAQHWAELILEDKGEIKQGVLTLTRILYPIIHFELGHYDLVENLTRSTYRYLLKLKRLHGFERLMVQYLQSLPFSSDSTEFKEKLNAFAKELEELKNDPKEKTTYGMEEVQLWVRSRQSSTSMAKLLTI